MPSLQPPDMRRRPTIGYGTAAATSSTPRQRRSTGLHRVGTYRVHHRLSTIIGFPMGGSNSTSRITGPEAASGAPQFLPRGSPSFYTLPPRSIRIGTGTTSLLTATTAIPIVRHRGFGTSDFLGGASR